MQTTITVRHCDIPDELKERAIQLLAKLAKVAHRPQNAEVIFNEDNRHRVVELRLTLPRGQVKMASADAVDFRTALDRAIAKLRNQLDKDPHRDNRRVGVE